MTTNPKNNRTVHQVADEKLVDGFDKKDYRISGLRYSDLRPGNYDGAEHLKDMDIDGIWASVVYPGFGASFYTHPDREVAIAGFTAFNGARQGEEDAIELLAVLGRRLGAGIASFVNIFEPEHVVIGGGLSAAADLFLDTARDEAAARALPALFERVQISVARAGNDAGVIGAGLLAAQELGLSGDTSKPRSPEEVR